MNKTLRLIVLLAAMFIATGQTWAVLKVSVPNNLYVESATGGTVAFYDNAECTGNAITYAAPGSTVYMKAVPDDILHDYPTVDMITAEKTVDSGAAQSRGTKRAGAPAHRRLRGIGLGEYVTVAAVGQDTGIFSFTMPDDGTSVSIAVTFPDAPVSYINEAGQTVDTGNETVHILTGSETSLDAGWYVAEGTLNYSECIWLNGDVHLILKDGAVMNVGTEESPISGYGIRGTSYSFCIYARSTGDSKGQLYVNANDDAIITKNVTICGGLVTASGKNGISALNNVTISGGQVTAISGTVALYAEDDIIINGGQVTAQLIETDMSEIELGEKGGMLAYGGNIILGATKASDFIQATSYVASGTLTIADGTTLYDEDGNAYSGTQTLIANPDAKPDDIFTAGTYAIDGKRLRPAANVTIAIGGAGVRTYASPYDLDFTGIEGLTAYVATSISGSTLTLTPVNYVPAGTGLMLKGTANTSFTVPLTNDAFAIENNLLVGLIEKTDVSKRQTIRDTDYLTYILANGTHGIGWYLQEEDHYELKANSAYLRLPEGGLAHGVRLTLEFEDNATSVGELKNGRIEELKSDDAWYSIDGVKLDRRPTRKGVYIYGGKKVVIK